jgi:hypothetical protein
MFTLAGVDTATRRQPFNAGDSIAPYHNRTCTYDPLLGRFMQSDPNGTGIIALETFAYFGTAINPHAVAADLQTLHTDGANFYQYLRSNPWGASDAMGLASDPFDMVDDFLATSMSQKTAFLSAVGNGTKAAAVMALEIASFLPGVGIVADLAKFAMGEMSVGELGFSMLFNLIPGGKLLRLLGDVAHGTMGLVMKYASKAGAKFLNGVVYMWGPLGEVAYGIGQGMDDSLHTDIHSNHRLTRCLTRVRVDEHESVCPGMRASPKQPLQLHWGRIAGTFLCLVNRIDYDCDIALVRRARAGGARRLIPFPSATRAAGPAVRRKGPCGPPKTPGAAADGPHSAPCHTRRK